MNEMQSNAGKEVKMFTVIDIIDGDTYKVSPDWKWNGKSGNVVRPLGFDTPERGEPSFEQATATARTLLSGKRVELKNPVSISYGRLVCEVWISGRNIAEYFQRHVA